MISYFVEESLVNVVDVEFNVLWSYVMISLNVRMGPVIEG